MPIVWVLIAGFIIRLYSASMRTIINPDGAQYIYQAGAFFNLEWSKVLACKIAYISPLPICIAGAFAVFKDWIVAGQFVNLLFGWAALWPLYHVVRRFFSRDVCNLTLLIYALIPVFVDGSSNVIRGPMFWFCLCLGMLFFVRQWDESAKTGRFRYDLITSAFLFLLATWCRIEGIVFLVAPFVYLCVTRNEHKLQKCCLFLLPIVVIGLAGAVAAMGTTADINTTFRIRRIVNDISHFKSNFHDLETWIGHMDDTQSGFFAQFLKRSRETLIMIPLVVIFHNFLEGVFYPFALIFFIGLFGLRRQYHHNRRSAYFAWQALAGFIVLYMHVMKTWIISYRFLAILIFPGCIIMAAGVEKTIQWLHNQRWWPQGKPAVCLAIVIVVLGLPKNLKPEESDKAVYRQAAQIIELQMKANPSAQIAGFERTRALEWIILYAHRNATSIPCSKSLEHEISPDYNQFVANLDLAGIDFVLYEERFWPHNVLDLPSAPYEKDFRLLGQWQHPDSKKFMLLGRRRVN